MATTPKKLRIDTNGNDAQREFVEAETRETYYFGGVGSGKTTGGVMRLGRHIYEWNPGETLAIVTPTVTMLRNVIIPELQKWGLYHEDWHTSTENRIDYPNGTTVILESAANLKKVERLRGLSIAGAWLDEISQHFAETYYVLDDRLRTGDYRNLWGTGTPKGMNWAYEQTVESVREGPHEEWSVEGGTAIQNDNTTTVYGVSTDANEATPEDYKESRKRQHTGQSLRQEVFGQFVQFEGLVYPWFSTDDAVEAEIGYTSTPDDAGHVVHDVPDIPVESVFYGVDWGFYPHPAAIIAFAKLRNGEIYALEEHVETRNTPEDLADVIIGTKTEKGMYDRYGQGPVYCDPSEPSNIEDFQRRGIQAQKADNSVDPGIGYVTSIRDKLRVYHTCQTLINELNQYRYKDGGDEPVKKNDHASDATRYALFTHSQNDVGNVGVAFG